MAKSMVYSGTIILNDFTAEGDISNIFSEDPSTLCSFRSNDTNGIASGAYIAIDLGEVKPIGTIYVQCGDSGSKINNARIEFSENGTDWTALGTEEHDVINIMDCNEGVRGRYVRVKSNINQSNVLKIRRFNVYPPEYATVFRSSGIVYVQNWRARYGWDDKLLDGTETSYARYARAGDNNSGVLAGEYIGVRLRGHKLVTHIRILQGTSPTNRETFINATLEYSNDNGKTYTPIQTGLTLNTIDVDLSENPIVATHVRLRNGSDMDCWLAFRMFKVTTDDNLLHGLKPGAFENFFYYSSMYSDTLLTKFLPKVKNQAYQRYMEIQKNILNDNERSWTATDFFTNAELSDTFALPLGTRFYTLEKFNLPIANRINFIRLYGIGDIKIAAHDLHQHTEIFSQVYRLMIGEYYFDKYWFCVDKYHRSWIAIPNDATGITDAQFEHVKAAPVFLWKDKPSAIFQETLNLSSAISTSTEGNKALSMNTNSNITPMELPYTDNSWDICISADKSQYGVNLSAVTQGYLLRIEDGKLVFRLPESFVNSIVGNASVLVTAIHRPNRRYSYVYTQESNTSPIIYLGEDDHPIPASNIKLYYYNRTTNRKGARLSILNLTPIHFPAVYDFTQISQTHDVIIEIIDYPITMTNTKFMNHLGDLINTLGTYNYTNSLISGDLSYYPEILNYNPINVTMDYDEFMSSDYSDNLREYKLRKLLDLMVSDPWVYMEYLQFMDSEVYGHMVEHGTPAHFKMNTGLTLPGLSDSSAPIVTDNAFLAICKHEDTVHFSEPHTFIKVRCENPDAYVRVFLNGRIIRPTWIESHLNDIYVFIPVSTCAEYLECYSTTDGVTNASFWDPYQLVIVEVMPNVDRDNSRTKYESVNFMNSTDFKRVFEDSGDELISLNDLVFYINGTGEYVSIDKFQFKFTLHSDTIEFADGLQQTLKGSEEQVLYLFTNAGELYMTQDNQPIILEEYQEDTIPDFTPNGDPSFGAIRSVKDMMNKKFPIKDIQLSVTDPTLFGTDIIVMIDRSVKEYCINATNEDHVGINEGTDKFTITFGETVGIINANGFEVYVNGTMIPCNECEITLPSDTNDACSISIPHVAELKAIYPNCNWDTHIVYTPIARSCERSVLHHQVSNGDSYISTSNFVDPSTVQVNADVAGRFVGVTDGHTHRVYLPNAVRRAMKFGGPAVQWSTATKDGEGVTVLDYKRDSSIGGLLPPWVLNTYIEEENEH